MAKLKIRSLKISAGRPVAILNKNFAEKASINVDDRINIERKNKRIIAVVDTAVGILKENEIAVSSEVLKTTKLKENEIVEVELAPKPESLFLIQKKLSCKKLTKKDMQKIMDDIVNNKLTESEIAYFIAGVYRCGMSLKETAAMTKAIVNSGKKLKLKGKVIDKHSTGGIPGRTTPIIVSICASQGLLIPKTSSRAITSPSGTADAMEVICKVDFSIKEIKQILKKTNACIVWGGSLGLAPADDKIIQVERLLNLDPEAQLLASIIAKKLAVDADYVLIDIPYGKEAKLTKIQAERLSRKFKKLGKYFNLKIQCSLKEALEPLGNGLGPALEIADVIKVLKRESPCYKLESRSIELSGKILEMAKKARKGKGELLAREILDSGLAFKKFKEIVKAQKGKVKSLRKAKYKYNIIAKRNCKIKEIKIKILNNLARTAGCPADKFSGLYLYKHLNDKVEKGDKILTIYAESQTELKNAVKYYKENNPIKF